MQAKHWLFRAMALVMAAMLAGCGVHRESFVYKLWHNDEFRHVREPATNAAIAVFYAPDRKDYLVAYNSLRDGDNKPQRLAYFLGEYESMPVEKRKPSFISTDLARFTAVPVNEGTNVLPYAVFDTRLTIHTSNGDIGPYVLPTYAETEGNGIKAALTPVAILGDVGCVSLILACVGAIALAQSGASFAVH
jgi:hypothetical protein